VGLDRIEASMKLVTAEKVVYESRREKIVAEYAPG